jgi:uncharacterized protein (DUF433 family)/DNA-binding transcriptional MerR regulator
MATMQAFSQDLVTRITGLTRRQLEYWDETDVIRPSIASSDVRGAPRLYSFRDLLKLRVAAKMRRKLLPSQMRDLMRGLERRGFEDPFVTVTFVETQDGGQIAFIDPESGTPLSAHGREIGTVVETFGLNLRDLRSGLERKIDEVTARSHGSVAPVRNVQGSRPVIVGTRVPAAKIAALADAGWTTRRILDAYPHLNRADVKAAIAYQAKQRTA